MNIFQAAFDKLRKQFDAIATPAPSASSSTKLDVILKAINILNDSINVLNERTTEMAISLDGLSQEIDRAGAAATGASEKIEKLLVDVRAISDEMAAVKAAAAENAVDTALLDQLIGKLRTSTDALEGTIKK